MNRSFFWVGCCAAICLAAPSFGSGDACAASPVQRSPAGEARTVELFDGIKAGDIEVKVIPKDAKEATVTIKNKTGQLLAIKVPEALAGVPVLAQAGIGFGNGIGNGLGNGFGNGIGNGLGNGNNTNQGFGGGPTGGGAGNWGAGNGFFNVGPDKAVKLKLTTVCLDHGLAEPNPRVPYELVPIESYAKDPAVTEVLKLMVGGQLDQPSAQAACWHLQNSLSWKELAAKIGARHLNGRVERFFTKAQLDRALAATNAAQNAVEARPASQASTSVATK